MTHNDEQQQQTAERKAWGTGRRQVQPQRKAQDRQQRAHRRDARCTIGHDIDQRPKSAALGWDQEGPQRRSHALATAKASEHRQQVAHKGRSSEPSEDPVKLRRVLRSAREIGPPQDNGQRCLPASSKEHNQPPALAQRPRRIRRSDVSRSDAAQVDLLEVRDHQAKRHRAKQVRKEKSDCHGHRPVLTTPRFRPVRRRTSAAGTSRRGLIGHSYHTEPIDVLALSIRNAHLGLQKLTEGEVITPRLLAAPTRSPPCSRVQAISQKPPARASASP